jgi:beta-lactam-binding protein with PASTA domain
VAKNNSTKSFFLNLLIIILLTIGILVAFFASLGYITKHGESITVPNVTGQNVDAAMLKISQMNLKPVVLDSTFYDSLPPLSIVSQTPAAGAKVKDGRIVYFTINQAVAPMIQMPDLTGYSLNSASLLLKSFGLKLGSYTYTASLVKDAVIKQQMGDSDIAAGVQVPKGTVINLVIGDGSGSQMMTVPNIIGMQVAEAREYIGSLNCSIGAVTPDIDVVHADSGYIYKQSPSPVANDSLAAGAQPATVRMKIGGMIDVWVSKNPRAPQQ